MEKLKEIEKKVNSLSNIAKVIGIVAVIFGIAGSWGYTLLDDAKKDLLALQKDVKSAEIHLVEVRKQEVIILKDFAKSKYVELEKISKTWPGGSYCVAKRSASCPAGFKEGKLHLDTEDDNGNNSWSGTLPEFKYQKNNIVMRYCCKGKK